MSLASNTTWSSNCSYSASAVMSAQISSMSSTTASRTGIAARLPSGSLDDGALLDVLTDAADAVRAALDGLTGWGPSGARPGQYRTDVVADAAAVAVLTDAGLGVLSEESGLHHDDRPLLAVLDPVDGSTNASRSLPWYATSVCVLDVDGPRVALVVNQATGERFDAVRGHGARCDG